MDDRFKDQGLKFKFKIDTGADVTVIPDYVFNTVLKGDILDLCEADSGTRMHPAGRLGGLEHHTTERKKVNAIGRVCDKKRYEADLPSPSWS